MDKKEFYKKLRSIAQSHKPYELDSLMTTSYKEDLPLLVKRNSKMQLEIIQPQGVNLCFIRCFTSEDEFKSSGVGTACDEINLKLACKLMMNDGYDGICFLANNGATLDLLWSDFISKKDMS